MSVVGRPFSEGGLSFLGPSESPPASSGSCLSPSESDGSSQPRSAGSTRARLTHEHCPCMHCMCITRASHAPQQLPYMCSSRFAAHVFRVHFMHYTCITLAVHAHTCSTHSVHDMRMLACIVHHVSHASHAHYTCVHCTHAHAVLCACACVIRAEYTRTTCAIYCITCAHCACILHAERMQHTCVLCAPRVHCT